MTPTEWACLILCPDCDKAGLQATVNSIKHHMEDPPMTCVVPKFANAQQLHDLSMICPVVRAGEKLPSLFNKALHTTKHEWNWIFLSGKILRPRFTWRYESFLESEKDICYPAHKDRLWCDVTPLHGWLMHRSAYKTVGKMAEINNSEEAKLVWCYNAIQHGFQFKGIVGTRF